MIGPVGTYVHPAVVEGYDCERANARDRTMVETIVPVTKKN